MAPGLAGRAARRVGALGGVAGRRGRGVLSEPAGAGLGPAGRHGPDGDGRPGLVVRRRGRRGRRWREAIVGDDGLRHSLLFETAPTGVQPPRAVDAGRAADAAPRGRRHAPRQRDRGRAGSGTSSGCPGTRAACRHRGVGGRGRGGVRRSLPASSARAGRRDGPAPRHGRAADHDRARDGRAHRRRDVADRRRPAVPDGRDGLPLLADAEAWPLEQRAAADSGKPRHGGPFVDALWTRSADGDAATRKLVDNAVVAPARVPYGSSCPKGQLN